MEVTIIKSGSIAINPQDVITLVKGDKLTLGDKGTTEANLKRMIELGFAKELGAEPKTIEPIADTKEEAIEETVEDETMPVDEEPSEIDTFDDKDDLELFAKEVYSVQLDKRKSLENMKLALKAEIKKEDK